MLPLLKGPFLHRSRGSPRHIEDRNPLQIGGPEIGIKEQDQRVDGDRGRGVEDDDPRLLRTITQDTRSLDGQGLEDRYPLDALLLPPSVPPSTAMHCDNQ